MKKIFSNENLYIITAFIYSILMSLYGFGCKTSAYWIVGAIFVVGMFIFIIYDKELKQNENKDID